MRDHGHVLLSESDINILQPHNNVSLLSNYYIVRDFNMKIGQIK